MHGKCLNTAEYINPYLGGPKVGTKYVLFLQHVTHLWIRGPGREREGGKTMYTVKKFLTDLVVLKFSQIEGNGRKFCHYKYKQ